MVTWDRNFNLCTGSACSREQARFHIHNALSNVRSLALEQGMHELASAMGEVLDWLGECPRPEPPKEAA